GLTKEDMNKKFSVQGKIEGIKQTGGPTLFTLFDGSGTLTIKGFISAGARAYPEINEDDVVTALVEIIEHEGVMEGEIIRIQKLATDQQDVFAQRLQKILYERSRPDNVGFLIQSPILDKLAPKIDDAVITIKMAIADNRPIILKHHADTDGYSAGMTLQRAILPLIAAQHNDEKSMWLYYKRTPSKSPYYDYFDATRDIGHSLSDNAKYNQKMPLIIIVDTGSGEEDALPIRKVKLFGCQVVVIDHHVPGKNDPISKLADVHINPHLVGDEYSYSAGMLCTEVARKINQKAENIDYIPALSGLADRIESPELEQYLKIAQDRGYSREFLERLGIVIDFEAWNFKFDESRELVDILFGSDKELQRKSVELLYPEIMSRFARQLDISRNNCEIKTVGKVLLAKLDIGAHSNFNTYPPAGKSLSSLHDWVQKEHPGKPVLSIGYAEDFVTIRATDGTDFSIIEFVDRVQKKFPFGGIDGGGHAHAGSIKAIPSMMPKILVEFENVLAGRQ
ncbi:MAG: hypothetical protein Q7R47_03695, partial [Candidatus Diapherotrites archaeon]|nr:hypothetical protein [Candidatus Diapherotrites archaeon]